MTLQAGKNVHDIILSGYQARPADAETLQLGTRDSYGIERLHLIAGPEWDGLTITATFHSPDATQDPIRVLANVDYMDVPPEATRAANTFIPGRIVFSGVADGVQRISSNLLYSVVDHAKIEGQESTATPSILEQAIAQVGASAQQAADSAAAAAGSASSASASQEAAAQSAADAARSAAAAGSGASTAAEKASQAAASEVAAKDHAEKALGSQTEAAKSEAAAQIAQTAASNSAQAADLSAKAAAASADAAAQVESGVTQSAEAAEQAANRADLSARTAADKATQAAASEAAAGKSAETAKTQADQANESQTEAAKSEAAAKAAQTSADASAQAAQAAQAGAEKALENLGETIDAKLQEAKDSGEFDGPPGLGVPTPTPEAAGKAATVNDAGDGYQLTGPYAPLASAIRPTANGNPAVCADSVAWPFQGIRVYGKSTQDGTPSPESPVPIVSAGEGGSVALTVNGKNLLKPNFASQSPDIYASAWSSDGTFTLPETIESGSKEFTIGIGATRNLLSDSPAGYLVFSAQAYVSGNYQCKLEAPGYEQLGLSANGISALVQGLNRCSRIQVFFSGITAPIPAGTKFKMSLSPTKDFTCEPYVSQSLPLSTPSGLPGIPVTSGGNYTDASGQQLICNFIDLNNFVSTYFLKIYHAKNYLNSLFKSGTTANNLFGITINERALPIASPSSNGATGLSNFFKIGQPYFNNEETFDVTNITENNFNLRFGFGLNGFSGLDEVRGWIEANDPVFLIPIYPITTPLSAEEIAAYRALTTYDGTTVVSTAEPVAGIETRYMMDGTAAWNDIQEIKKAFASYESLSASYLDGVDKSK